MALDSDRVPAGHRAADHPARDADTYARLRWSLPESAYAGTLSPPAAVELVRQFGDAVGLTFVDEEREIAVWRITRR